MRVAAAGLVRRMAGVTDLIAPPACHPGQTCNCCWFPGLTAHWMHSVPSQLPLYAQPCASAAAFASIPKGSRLQTLFFSCSPPRFKPVEPQRLFHHLVAATEGLQQPARVSGQQQQQQQQRRWSPAAVSPRSSSSILSAAATDVWGSAVSTPHHPGSHGPWQPASPVHLQSQQPSPDSSMSKKNNKKIIARKHAHDLERE
jgi:hypothetical protein